jgi:hypothetical protein
MNHDECPQCERYAELYVNTLNRRKARRIRVAWNDHTMWAHPEEWEECYSYLDMETEPQPA